MKKQSRVKGIAISYITTVVRTLSKLLLIPLYKRILGLDDYGYYQYVFSIAGYASILDFGISSVVNTFSIRHRENGDTEGVENVMFHALMFSLGSAAVITACGLVLGIGAPVVFGAAVSDRIGLTRTMLALIIAELILLMFQHYFEGYILASEKYVTLRMVALIQILFRCLITVTLLYGSVGVLSIALGDLLGVGICLAFEILYCRNKLGLRIRYHYRDRALIAGIAKLSLALCLQSVVTYLNSSIDKFILGRLLGTAMVAIYTFAVTFSTFFDEIPTVIQRLYLPQVVKLVSSGADGEELTSFVIKPGRYQCVLVGGVLGGFILFGRQFITMWTGKDTLDAWKAALFLMVPSVLPLIQNVCLSILTAMNKRLFRSYVLCCIAIANLGLTIFLVKRIGFMGAPIGTCISLILGNNIAMNWYYKTRIGINVKRLFLSILKGILPCAAAAICLCIPLLFVPLAGKLWFCAECAVFCAVYAVLLLLFGLNQEEKREIKEVFLKKLKKS